MEKEAPDSERPTLSVINPTQNATGLTPSDAGREAGSFERTKRGPAKERLVSSKQLTSAEDDLLPEQVAANYAALQEFLSILRTLVESPEPIEKQNWSERFRVWRKRHGFVRLVSSSIYGKPLTRRELVGEYTNLWPVLEHRYNLALAQSALLGLLALKSGHLQTAQSVLEDIRFSTSSPLALTLVMRGVMRFVFSIVFIVYFGFVFALEFVLSSDFSQIANYESTKVVLAAFFGCLGGVVSLLMRLAEFERTRGRSKQFLLLSGATQPIVGGIFAAVVGALLASNMVNLTGLNVWHYTVIGFLAGFSERFARNVLSIAEGQISRPTPGPDSSKSG
jgi:hypothetical protein